LQILREQQVALEGDAASFNYISKSTDERESLSMVCTDSICRTYEAIQIEDQKSQILRTKKLQKDMMLSMQAKKTKDGQKDDEGSANGPDKNSKQAEKEENGNQNKDDKNGKAASDENPECLIDPNTGKKMSLRRMNELIKIGGALPQSQVDELTRRGLLVHGSFTTATKLKNQLLQGNQKFQQEQEQMDSQL